MTKLIQATIKVIKAADKSNITASISRNDDGSFRSYNFSGKLTSLDGFVTKDGKSYDKELVQIDCVTTALVFSENQGSAIYERCAEIFAQREANNDPNPAVDILLTLKTVRPKATNILLVNIKEAFVDADTQVVDNSETVEDAIAMLQANAAKNKANAPKQQVSAARAGLSGLAKRIVKTYL